MQVSESLAKQVELFVSLLNERSRKDAQDKAEAGNRYETGKVYYQYRAEEKPGRKFWKVVMWLHGADSQTSIYCFLDEAGNVYKPASWEKPAKHIRGNIFGENPLQGTGVYGVDYLK